MKKDLEKLENNVCRDKVKHKYVALRGILKNGAKCFSQAGYKKGIN